MDPARWPPTSGRRSASTSLAGQPRPEVAARRMPHGLGSLEQRDDLLFVRRLFLDAKLAVTDVARAVDQKRRGIDLDAAKGRQGLVIHHSNDVIHALALDEFLHSFDGSLVDRDADNHQPVLAVLF